MAAARRAAPPRDVTKLTPKYRVAKSGGIRHGFVDRGLHGRVGPKTGRRKSIGIDDGLSACATRKIGGVLSFG
jgi:hypothetical protein